MNIIIPVVAVSPLRKFVAKLTQEFERKFKETIALMPKQDLIELAEALVSITAIERKASDDAGTVGGPIDVALITRSEGFVWVKRKHHFSADRAVRSGSDIGPSATISRMSMARDRLCAPSPRPLSVSSSSMLNDCFQDGAGLCKSDRTWLPRSTRASNPLGA